MPADSGIVGKNHRLDEPVMCRMFEVVAANGDLPIVERCSWDEPQYHELLRRGIRWALGADA